MKLKREMLKKLIIIAIIPFIYSCSVEKIAIKKTSLMIDEGISDIYSEKNLDYIKNSLPASLKLMEILYKKEQNPILLKNLTMGFCGYAFAFYDEKKFERNNFYLKGIKYSDDYIQKQKLKEKKTISQIDFDIIFWNLFCKSVYVDSNRDDINALVYLNEIEEAAQKLNSINPSYFYGSVSTILASIYSLKPKLAGGNPEKSKEIFESVINSKDGKKLLMNHLFYAKSYATTVLDEELFDKLINYIIEYNNPTDELGFFNEIAKIKAKKLKEEKNEIF
jgi:hypothetical protein